VRSWWYTQVGGERMRKVTTVSLDEKTAAIAKNMPNFSHFVRECLLRHHASSLNQDECPHIRQERFGNRCVPRVKGRPVCFVCWPHGRPSQDLVTSFLRNHEDLERLDRETKAENWQLLNLDQGITVQESARLPSKGGGNAHAFRPFSRKWCDENFLRRLLRR
jgi:hypothetical protein